MQGMKYLQQTAFLNYKNLNDHGKSILGGSDISLDGYYLGTKSVWKNAFGKLDRFRGL